MCNYHDVILDKTMRFLCINMNIHVCHLEKCFIYLNISNIEYVQISFIVTITQNLYKPMKLGKFMMHILLGVVILPCTKSSRNHCLIFWTLDCNNKNNKINYYEYIMYISQEFRINIMNEKYVERFLTSYNHYLKVAWK